MNVMWQPSRIFFLENLKIQVYCLTRQVHLLCFLRLLLFKLSLASEHILFVTSYLLFRLNIAMSIPEIVFVGPKGQGKSALIETILGHVIFTESRMILWFR